MSGEDIKYLSQFESNFNTAIKSNYSRNILSSQLKKMVEIYENETGCKYNLCLHCSSAVLGFLKDLGKLYFKKVQEGFEPELNNNELEETVTEVVYEIDYSRPIQDRTIEIKTKKSTPTNTKNKEIKKMKNAKYTTE